jgi:hypothetical protein
MQVHMAGQHSIDALTVVRAHRTIGLPLRIRIQTDYLVDII